MEDYTFLLLIALILVFTKLFGLLSEKVHLPQVVGALVAGILLGPTGLNILHSTDFLAKTAELGVIILMFTAGIDTDLNELKDTGMKACVIAVMGVFVPLFLCGGLYFVFFNGTFTAYDVLKAAFVGSIFSATSVGITVETLNEMGKLKSKTGTTLLSAALIDDIIGIIVLSVLSGFSTGNSNVITVIIKIGLFFGFVFLMALLFHKVFYMISADHGRSRRVAVWAFAFCLVMAYCAETFFGVADITGAYFAGLTLCSITKSRQHIAKKMTVTSYMIFVPVFFASVGMKTNLRMMNSHILVFALFLVIAAVISKVIGCGLGAKMCRLSNHESLVIGIGMVARSEVALMVAQKGMSIGMVDEAILPAIILTVIVSALATPILLKLSISKGGEIA